MALGRAVSARRPRYEDGLGGMTTRSASSCNAGNNDKNLVRQGIFRVSKVDINPCCSNNSSSCSCGNRSNEYSFREAGLLPSMIPGRGTSPKKISRSTFFHRPVLLVFLAQALLSFVVVFVIPVRLAYDLLIIQPTSLQTPSTQSGSRAQQFTIKTSSNTAIFSTPRLRSGGDVSVVPTAPRGTVARPLREPGGTNAARVPQAFQGLVSPPRVKSGGRTSTRVLMQTDDDDSESYFLTTNTTFVLCLPEIDSLDQETLLGTLIALFDVQDDAIAVEWREVTDCPTNSNFTAWEVTIGNEKALNESAAATSARQMERVRSVDFSSDFYSYLFKEPELELKTDFALVDTAYTALGFYVGLEGETSTAASNGRGSDFQDVLGPDQWWPWWSWLLFGLGLLCCVCPLAACIYHFRPGRSGPPNPSGSGSGSGMFNSTAESKTFDGFSKEVEGGGGGSDSRDYNMKDYEKNAGYEDGGGYFNDAATGVSTDSPLANLSAVQAAEGARAVPAWEDAKAMPPKEEAERQRQSDEWPMGTLEAGTFGAIGVTGTRYTSQESEDTGTIPSEADRAAGGDPTPTRQAELEHEDLTRSAPSSSGDFKNGAGKEDNPSRVWWVNPPHGGTAESTTVLGMGPSGRSLGSAATAFGGGSGSFQAEGSTSDLGGEGSAAVSAGSGGSGGSDLLDDKRDGGRSIVSSGSFAPSGSLLSSATGHDDDDDDDYNDTSGARFDRNIGGAGKSEGHRLVTNLTFPPRPTSTGIFGGRGLDPDESEYEGGEYPDSTTGEVDIGPAAAAAAAAALPSSSKSLGRGTASERSSESSTSHSGSYSYDASGAKVGVGSGGGRPGSVDAAAVEMRDVTDEERQSRMEESDAARAASLLRASASKVPLQPDLERAITVEEQIRRRQAVEEVESRRSSNSAVPTAASATERTAPVAAEASPLNSNDSVVSKVLTGVGRFFGMGQDDAVRSSPASTSTSAGDKAVGAGGDAPDLAGAGGVSALPPTDAATATATTATTAAAAFAAPAATAKGSDGTGAADDGAYVPAPVDGTGIGGGGGGGGAVVQPAAAAASGVAIGAGVAAAAVGAGFAAAGQGHNQQAEAAGGGTRPLSPDEVQAYSDNVDRTLEVLPDDDGSASLPMSELLARAELDARSEGVTMGQHPAVAAATAAAPTPSTPPPPAVAAARAVGLPPLGPSQAAAFALQQHSATGSKFPTLDLARLIHSAEAGGMTLDELEDSLASPIIATPPTLIRPNVGAAARGAAARGRSLLHNRPSGSGSFVSSGSASLTEDHGSNAALTEDDLSSDAHTTDVSRTSSFVAGGSSFEESLAQTQAASGHFLNISRAANNPPSSSIDDDMDTNNDSANASVAAAGGGSNNLSSLAERLARAEETVAREHEKGLLYRQGPEGVAAAVVGEDLAPLPPLDPSTVGGAPDRAPRGGDSGGGDMGGGGGGWSEDEEQEEVQSLANMLARADDGPGNLKDAFQLLDDMEANRLEELSAAALAEGADLETKARWRGSLAELMVKADRSGHLRNVLDVSSGASADNASEEGVAPFPSDSTASSSFLWDSGQAQQSRPE